MWDVQDYRYATNPVEAVAMMRQGPGKGAYPPGAFESVVEDVAGPGGVDQMLDRLGRDLICALAV